MTRLRGGAAAPGLEAFTAAAFTPAVSASPAGDTQDVDTSVVDMPAEDTSRADMATIR
jgi:hypothetical protein